MNEPLGEGGPPEELELLDELLLDVLEPDELLELFPDELELLLDEATPEELPDDELLDDTTPDDELVEEEIPDDELLEATPPDELLLLDGPVIPLEELLVDPPLDEELPDEELGVVGVTELGVTAALSVDPPPPPPPHPAIANARVAVETYARIERIADLPSGRVSVFYEPFAVLIQRSPLSR